MDNLIEIVSVPVIATAVCWMVNLIKYAVKSNEIFMRLIPLIAAVLGAGLGIIAFYALPSVIAADNWLMALLILRASALRGVRSARLRGGASGLSATGVNQVIKQLGKPKNIKNEEEKTDGNDERK